MPAATTALLTPGIDVGGAPLSPEQLHALVELQVERALSRTSRCTLRFTDHAYVLAGAVAAGRGFKVGAILKVTATGGGVFFDGEIVSVESERHGAEAPELFVTAYDRSLRLAHATVVANYLKMSPSDIVRKVAQKEGLTVQVPASTPGDYTLVADTVLGVVDALCERAGWAWAVQGTKLTVTDPKRSTAIPVVVDGSELSYLSVRGTAAHPTKARVDGWDSVAQKAVTGEATLTPADLGTDAAFATKLANGIWGAVRLERNAELGVLDAAEAKRVAAALLRRSASSATLAVGEGAADAKLVPGGAVKLQKVGPLNGTYLLTEVEHRYTPDDGLVTRFTSGSREPAGLGAMLGADAEPAALRVFTKAGLVVGQVTNINDPESRGRVQVRFVGIDTEQQSAWARVMAMGGGDKRGMVFLPEVKDEVLVGFEAGDLRRPVVLGGLYGTTSSIPEWSVTNGKVTARRITSRSGHVVQIAEADNADPDHIKLELKAQGKVYKLRLGKDRFDVEVPDMVPLALKAGTQSSMTFDGKGNIVIKGLKVTIEATTDLELKGLNIKGTAMAQLGLEGTAMAQLKGALVTVQASGVAAVKGALVQIN